LVDGVVSTLMGWAGSVPPESLSPRNFSPSVGGALIAGAVYATTLYSSTANLTKDILIAVVWVVGGDAMVNLAVGAVQV
jgi:hypothetical protein